MDCTNKLDGPISRGEGLYAGELISGIISLLANRGAYFLGSYNRGIGRCGGLMVSALVSG